MRWKSSYLTNFIFQPNIEREAIRSFSFTFRKTMYFLLYIIVVKKKTYI